MSLRRVVSPLVTLVVLGAAGYAAYLTQDRWVPFVFPAKAAKPAKTAKTAKESARNSGWNLAALAPPRHQPGHGAILGLRLVACLAVKFSRDRPTSRSHGTHNALVFTHPNPSTEGRGRCGENPD